MTSSRVVVTGMGLWQLLTVVAAGKEVLCVANWLKLTAGVSILPLEIFQEQKCIHLESVPLGLVVLFLLWHGMEWCGMEFGKNSWFLSRSSRPFPCAPILPTLIRNILHMYAIADRTAKSAIFERKCAFFTVVQ